MHSTPSKLETHDMGWSLAKSMNTVMSVAKMNLTVPFGMNGGRPPLAIMTNVSFQRDSVPFLESNS